MVPEDILTTCIAAVEAGEDPATVLARYPDHAAELAPLLGTVVALRRAPKPRMSDEGFARARRRLAQVAAYQAAMQRRLIPHPLPHRDRQRIARLRHRPRQTPRPRLRRTPGKRQPPAS